MALNYGPEDSRRPLDEQAAKTVSDFAFAQNFSSATFTLSTGETLALPIPEALQEGLKVSILKAKEEKLNSPPAPRKLSPKGFVRTAEEAASDAIDIYRMS